MRGNIKAIVLLSGVVFSGTATAQSLGGDPGSASAIVVDDGFEVGFDGWTNSGDGAPVLTAVRGEGFNSARAMRVSQRTSPEHGAASLKGFYLVDGVVYDYSVQVKHAGASTETFNLTLQWQRPDGVFESKVVASAVVKPNTWTALVGSYATPKGSIKPTFFLTTNSTIDFYYDQFTAAAKNGDAVAANTAFAARAAATPTNVGLKDIYAKHFRVGNILNSGTVNNAGIRSLMQLDYNSISSENEHKPDAMLTRTGSTNTNIRAQIGTGTAAIMNFCQQNNIPMRGHVLTWHGQTPDWFFVQDINDARAMGSTAAGPRYRDIAVSQVPWASVATMNARLESYIQNLFALYKTQYPNFVFYAYDVVNEAAGGDGGVRAAGFDAQGAGGQVGSIPGASPWQAVYGATSIAWIRNAFTYARKYAPAHTKLFYNDFNEWHEPKRNWIATNILTPFHRDGILDGMGMQSHVSANPADSWSGENRHLAAMEYFANLGIEVQLTELDPGTNNGQYASQQPTRYANIFKKALEINAKKVGKVTAICIWAPNDANTWLGSEDSPALHNASNARKPAYDAIAALVPESQWGDGDNPTFEFGGGGSVPMEPNEPNEFGWWFQDTFEENAGGWQGRGDAAVATSTAQKALGQSSLAVTGRAATWHGAVKDLPADFVADTTYSFSVLAAYTDGDATEQIKLTLEYTLDGETQWAAIDTMTVQRGQWVQLANRNFRIPTGATGLRLVVESPSDSAIPLYIDEVIGAVAGTTIVAPAGVTTKETAIAKPGVGDALRPKIALNGRTLSISMPSGDPMRIRVFNTEGKTVANHVATGNAKISLEKAPAGLFFVEARGAGIVNTTSILLD